MSTTTDRPDDLIADGYKTVWKDELILILNSINFVSGDNRLSRAGAFLVLFTFIHSLPNIFLLFDKHSYNQKARNMQSLPGLILVECYLFAAIVLHAILAVKSAQQKPISIVAVSGSLLGAFIVKHLLDFRFGGFQQLEVPSDALILFSNPMQRYLYLLGVFTAGIHVWKAAGPGFFYRLGLRQRSVSIARLVVQLMVLISTASYIIPILL